MTWVWEERARLSESDVVADAVCGDLWVRAWGDPAGGPWLFMACRGTFNDYLVLGTGAADSEELAKRSAEEMAESARAAT